MLTAVDRAGPSTDRPTILERLRRETRELHEAIERDVDIARCLQSRDAYRSLLTRWWGVLAVTEPAMAAVLDPGLFAHRRKIELLRCDLKRLGLSAADIASIPLCNAATPRSEAEALGVLYVLEGSTLGGQIIARMAIEALGADVPLSFYHPYGRKAGVMWRDCRSALSQRATPAAEDIILAWAKNTFEQLSHWFRAQQSSAAVAG